MKRHFLILGLMVIAISMFSQIRTPPLSQKQKLEQKVGFTEVTIEYCRPQMKGRTIFGGLEKYGEVWRTGANRNTQITFSESVSIGGTSLEPGTYTLLTRPNLEEWEVYFYPYDNGYGVPDGFSVDIAEAVITVPAFNLNRDIQTLTINLENVTENTADLTLMWERTYIAIPLQFTTESKIMSKIDDMINSHSGDYYTAAKYYLDNDKNLEKAKEFIQKSIDLREEPGGTPKFWIYQMKAEILLANKEKKAALQSAEKALEMAKYRGDDDFYVLQITALLNKIKS